MTGEHIAIKVIVEVKVVLQASRELVYILFRYKLSIWFGLWTVSPLFLNFDLGVKMQWESNLLPLEDKSVKESFSSSDKN